MYTGKIAAGSISTGKMLEEEDHDGDFLALQIKQQQHTYNESMLYCITQVLYRFVSQRAVQGKHSVAKNIQISVFLAAIAVAWY